MDIKLSKKLTKKFDFFKYWNYEKNRYERPEGWYYPIDCGNGWFKIIWKLCEEIEKIVDTDTELEKSFVVDDVKEKFGGLRFYCSWDGDDRIFALISKAEDESYKTCEDCGKKGKLLTIAGWESTLCNKCAIKRKKELKKKWGINA